jgi:CcmD family protein
MYRTLALPRRCLALALCSGMLSLAAVVQAQAQAPDTPVSSDGTVAPAAAAGDPGATASPAFQGVEAAPIADRGQPPRTLRAYWHVFIAFAVTWLLLFGYALSLGRRWAALERQLQVEGMASRE